MTNMPVDVSGGSQLIIIINYTISPAVLRKIKKEEGKSRKSVENCFSQINNDDLDTTRIEKFVLNFRLASVYVYIFKVIGY